MRWGSDILRYSMTFLLPLLICLKWHIPRASKGNQSRSSGRSLGTLSRIDWRGEFNEYTIHGPGHFGCLAILGRLRISILLFAHQRVRLNDAVSSSQVSVSLRTCCSILQSTKRFALTSLRDRQLGYVTTHTDRQHTAILQINR